MTDDSQLVNTSGIIGAPPNAKSFDGGYRSSTSTIHQSMLENSNILMNTSGVSIIPRKPRNSSRASYKHLKDAAAEPEMPAHQNMFSPNNMTTTLNHMMMLGSTLGSGDCDYNDTAKQGGIMPYNPQPRQPEPSSALSTQDAHH